MDGSVTLKVYSGDALVGEFPVTRDIVKIGRLPTAHLRLDDPAVSRIHAILTAQAGALSLVDMGSERGTLLNGRRVTKASVRPGDEILMGSTRIVVALCPAEPAAPSVSEPAISPALLTPPAPAEEPEAASREHRAEEAPPLSAAVRSPLPRRERSIDSQPLALHIRYYWGDTLLQASQHPAPRPVYVGATPRCELELSAERLGALEHALIVPSDDGFAVTLGARMSGTVDRGDGPVPLAPGLSELGPSDVAAIELGDIRAELCFRPQLRLSPLPWIRHVDLRFLNSILMAFVCVGAFVISAATHASVDIEADDLSADRWKVIKVVLREPPKPPPLVEKVRKAKLEAEVAQVPATTSPAPKRPERKPAVTRPAGGIRFDSSAAVSRLFGGGGPGISAGFGSNGPPGPGVGLRDAVASLGRPGSGGPGFGGLDSMMRGPGGPGFGPGNAIGIGPIAVPGGDRPGPVVRLERGPQNRGPHVIASGPEETGGQLPRELIREVIRRRIAQVRFCYEQALQSNPALAGRVRVEFLIAPDGRVRSARVAEGTTLDDSSLTDCLVARVGSWEFPQPKGGGSVKVTYPFVFKPVGD